MPASKRLRSVVVLPLMVLGLLFATFSTATPEAQALTRAQKISNGLSVARNQIGDPYRYGAAGPNAFDCSGLLYFSFRRAGFTSFPRTSDAQYRFVRHIAKSNLRPGDFVFFHRGGDVYLTTVIAGPNYGLVEFIHAPRSGERVKYGSPWTTSWYAGTLRGL